MVRKSFPFLLAFVCAFSALATSVKRLSLTEVRDRAASVVRGTVVGEQVRAEPTMVWTDYIVRVDEVLSGSATAELVTISFGGGDAPERPAIVVGAPRLEVGQSYVLFLSRKPDKPLLVPTVGWGQGVYQLVRTDEGAEALVSTDGEPIEMAGEGSIARGGHVQVMQGRIVDRAPRRVEAQSERARIAAPVARNADGSPALLVPAKPPAKEAAAPRRLATMKELREFVTGARAEVIR